MSTIKESIKISIDRLTHLLQLSLAQYSPENARMLTKTIVDLIDHTTMLSMETNDLIDKHKKRDLELCSCLVEMDALVKKQRKKLQMVPTKAPTLDKGLSTDDVCCNTCKAHEETIRKLQYNVDALDERNGTLQGKLLQSKYLLQAQQILLAKRASHDVVFEHARKGFTRDEFKSRNIENMHRKDSADWRSNLCEEEPDNMTRTHIPHRTADTKEGLPPMRPNLRYREVVVEHFDKPSLEEEEEDEDEERQRRQDGEGKKEEDAEGEDGGDYYSHRYGAEDEDEDEEEEEEEEENEVDAPDDIRYYATAATAAATDWNEDVDHRVQYENDSSGGRSLEYQHNAGSYEEQEGNSGSSGSSGSRGSSESGGGRRSYEGEKEDEEQHAEEQEQLWNRRYADLHHGMQHQHHQQQREASHSLDVSRVSLEGGTFGDTDDNDEGGGGRGGKVETRDDYLVPGHSSHRYHQDAQKYRTGSKVSLGIQPASHQEEQELKPGQEPGPGWDNHLDDNVEDSFSLIQNFYDIGFT